MVLPCCGTPFYCGCRRNMEGHQPANSRQQWNMRYRSIPAESVQAFRQVQIAVAGSMKIGHNLQKHFSAHFVFRRKVGNRCYLHIKKAWKGEGVAGQPQYSSHSRVSACKFSSRTYSLLLPTPESMPESRYKSLKHMHKLAGRIIRRVC
jgi:hypothetical protein